MAKPKKIVSLAGTYPDNRGWVANAMDVKFPQFKFTLLGEDLVAEGPWELKANERPAMGTMVSFAEGYVQALNDHK